GALATTTCGSGGVTGGVNNWIPLWTGASSLATSSLQQNGTTTFTQMGFAIGTSTIQPSGNLYVARGVTFAGLGSAGNPCVSVGATGILATSTCSGGSLSGGQSNYIPIWTNATTLGTSSLQQNGTTTFTLGGIAIGTSTAQNQGNIYITGNYLGGTISAGLVSSNAFGSGNFAFPGSLAVGTSNTALADALTVVGTTLLSGNATTTGAFSVGGNLSEQGSLLDVGGLLFATGAFVNVSNSTASTSLISATLANGTTTIPANVLRAGSIIHLKAFGLWNTTSTAQTATFWIKLGSNAIQSPNGPTTAGINNKGWIMQCDITIWSAGASGVWSPSCMFSGFAGGGAATPNQNYIDGSTSTIDTTSAAKLDVLWQWGSAFTTNSMTSTQVVAELEP
ncbi:MAG TPA: hypothetical protein VMU07_02705, partial [Candidatus Paceibacterota bacterium]|nr:hypothetical protein [Candidatus Paceibacterota bacterium]